MKCKACFEKGFLGTFKITLASPEQDFFPTITDADINGYELSKNPGMFQDYEVIKVEKI
jgi:hypothetical protein